MESPRLVPRRVADGKAQDEETEAGERGPEAASDLQKKDTGDQNGKRSATNHEPRNSKRQVTEVELWERGEDYGGGGSPPGRLLGNRRN